MTMSAGFISNTSKAFGAGIIGVGALVGGYHVLDRIHGPTGTIEPNPPGTTVVDLDSSTHRWVPAPRTDDWRGAGRMLDAAVVGGGVASLVGGAITATNDLTTAARALGETAVSDAIRGGKIRAGAETAIGLGMAAVLVGSIAAVALPMLEGE